MVLMPTRKQRAHDTERLVANWFAGHGWPHAEPVGAGRAGSDVTGMPGLLVEVKARRAFQPTDWLNQHKQLAIDLDQDPKQRPIAHPFVVFRPDGFGPARIGAFGVLMRLDSFTALLREADYGG